ncbi:MAG: bifunctional diaminohydroxyphosphoribosylaminopyrimidine deaminase/5-amino-6-(5-phosphoribosylamino)uracil reductase RibD [Nitratireductor sp.]|nr:bifunctional diaminohydroxyphosphoribosylaminopyrimidine deaminase/5-amino-6-(5-phosphoribosylamino)uracil reductase RibD [Nitratireductor sp.]
MDQERIDQRFMAAAIRLARRNEGLTGTNPSVACVLVRDDGEGAYVIASGITAPGGRPHAEPLALAEAGDLAKGATAYVTLEPCAHHGRTPPCAQTLIDAGVARVVTAVVDPDERVNEKGHAMLRAAGVEVSAGCMARDAAEGLAAYLIQKANNRSQVTLKLAVSADGFIGKKGQGQVSITGPVARAQSHLMRARHHAILVGAGTVIEDNPELTCRLPGLEARSPIRILLDPKGRIPLAAKTVQTAGVTRTIMVLGEGVSETHRAALRAQGCEILPCETTDGRVALPELLEDLAAIGIHSVLVEGGAKTAAAFLEEDLVDELMLFAGAVRIGNARDAITSPVGDKQFAAFDERESLALGEDRLTRYTVRRKGR